MSTSSTEIDRLALRIGALHAARRRRSIRDGAWAAERLRLQGIVLDHSDARFARDAVLRFGHALRIARVRRPWSGRGLAAAAVLAPRSWLARAASVPLVAAALAILLFIGVVLFIARPHISTDGERAAAGGALAGGAVPTASPLRGRSDGIIVAVPAPRTPAPTTAPGATAAPGATEQPEEPPGFRATPGPGTGFGGGGGTGGPGGGTGTGTATRTPVPTPSPTPENVMHLHGRVLDANGLGLPGVCVVIGATSCTLSPTTNEFGDWTVDLAIGQTLSYELKFQKTNYLQQQVSVPSRPGIYYLDNVVLRSLR